MSITIANDESTSSQERNGRIVAVLFCAATDTVALFVLDIVGVTVGVFVIVTLPAALVYNDKWGMFPARVPIFAILVWLAARYAALRLPCRFWPCILNEKSMSRIRTS